MLRTVRRQQTTTEQVSLLHKLVSMSESTGLKLLTRYHSLVATINGTPQPDPDPGKASALREWPAAALRCSAESGPKCRRRS
ncbi:hypothetical protein [Amycolatopsis sp. NBC_01286]|uniref:hypothetical protein n=1 Tax=Amycolatopsis sp. NBC_01286 TaxID=2903560 RepID=UPI002E113958|nr:hypothetical protein OG570_37570 [Amycolatopsis sp. NBC_01286]